MRNKNLVQKNIEDFNNILNLFFSNKGLTRYNYLSEFNVLNKSLKENFKELKMILSKQENFEEIYDYLLTWKLDILKRESIKGRGGILRCKKTHCYNLLRHLELKQKKGINQNFEVIYKNFFTNFSDDIYEYFRRKTREE